MHRGENSSSFVELWSNFHRATVSKRRTFKRRQTPPHQLAVLSGRLHDSQQLTDRARQSTTLVVTCGILLLHAIMRVALAVVAAAAGALQLLNSRVEGSRSVESAYDTNKGVFSPQGRLVQLDYVEVCAGTTVFYVGDGSCGVQIVVHGFRAFA